MLESPNLLVVVDDRAATVRYAEELQAVGASSVIIGTPVELSILPKHTEYSGMIVDLNSFVRLSAINKAIIKEYALVLPTIKLFFNPETDHLKITNLSFGDSSIESINDFVALCATFPARSIRREPRYNIILNSMLGGSQTIITDISKSGCFIFTTDGSLKVGDKIEFHSTNLGDQTPISGLIRRKVEGEKEGLVPGIGVDILSMTKVQENKLDALLATHVKRMLTQLDGEL